MNLKEMIFYHSTEKKIMARRYFIDENGLRQGLYQSWHPSWRLDGKPHIKANYKDGKLEGEYTVWYDNGVLEEEANYKDGKRYIRRGWIEGEANYKDDKLEEKIEEKM